MIKFICHCSRLIRTFPSGDRELKAWPAGPVPKKIKKLKIKKLKILKIKGFGLGKGLKAWPAGPVRANKLSPLKGLLVEFDATES